MVPSDFIAPVTTQNPLANDHHSVSCEAVSHTEPFSEGGRVISSMGEPWQLVFSTASVPAQKSAAFTLSFALMPARAAILAALLNVWCGFARALLSCENDTSRFC